MASPAVTYTFVNATTISHAEVNQNFTDIINGITDGTKDLSISALTCAGTATLNGNINLGNASGDDLTITASLASTIAIKTNNTYNIGAATLGLAGVYYGAPSSRSTRITANQSLSASHTMVLPNGNAAAADSFLTDDASGNLSWVANRYSPAAIENVSVIATVSANAMTWTLSDDGGSALSSTNIGKISFRSSTLTNGAFDVRSITGNLTVVAPSGATLGLSASVAKYVYVYAIDNAGTVELATSSTCFRDEDKLINTTAIDTASDSISGIYSTTARNSVAFRLLGKALFSLGTPGTWASSATEQGMFSLPIAIPDSCMAIYETAAGQSIGASSEVRVQYDTKVWDPYGAVTTGGSWVFTAPVAGIYHVSAVNYLSSTAWAASVLFSLTLQGGGTNYYIYVDHTDAAVTHTKGLQGSGIVKLAAGGTCYITLNQGHSGAVTLVAAATLNSIVISYVGSY